MAPRVTARTRLSLVRATLPCARSFTVPSSVQTPGQQCRLQVGGAAFLEKASKELHRFVAGQHRISNFNAGFRFQHPVCALNSVPHNRERALKSRSLSALPTIQIISKFKEVPSPTGFQGASYTKRSFAKAAVLSTLGSLTKK